MKAQNDTEVLLYCAGAIHPPINTLKTIAQNINQRKNIEDIHDIRVASRRIRTCLAIFSDYLPAKKVKAWTKDIQKITQSYGAVRDLDVQIDLVDKVSRQVDDAKLKPGLRRIKLRLNQRRRKKQAKVITITQAIFESSTIGEMKDWCEAVLITKPTQEKNLLPLYQLGYEQIQTRLDEFLFFEVFIFDPTRVKELHKMRIAAKKLRYTLEVFSDLYNKDTDFALNICRQCQEDLGQIHDADVWINFLPSFMESELQRVRIFYGQSAPFTRLRPGIEYLIKNRQNERHILYEKFLNEWHVWKMEETWLNLRKIIFLTSMESSPLNLSTMLEDTPIIKQQPIDDKGQELPNA